jgi:ATP-dependent RNA circularization protein (DNA/RNA ligase family)
MTEYHKIQSIFKRDMESPGKKLIIGEWSTPEFIYLANCQWEFTEKVDGTNVRVIWDGKNIAFRGRTDRAVLPIELLRVLDSTFTPLKSKFLERFGETEVVLYGEGYGPKIQNGAKYSSTASFVLFDIKIGCWYLQRADLASIADEFKVEAVPVVGYGTLFQAVERAVDGFPSLWGAFEAEGIVARPVVRLLAASGERLIAKIKCRDFR